MKPFLVWLAFAVAILGGVSVGSHLYLSESQHRILIGVDASFPMRDVWDKVPGVIKTIEGGRYSVYSLITDKGLVHDWSAKPRLNTFSPYGPRNINKILSENSYRQIDESSERYLITNANENDITDLSGWELIRLQ